MRAAITAICLNGLRAAGRAHDEPARKAAAFLSTGGLHPRGERMPPKPEVRVYALAYGLMAVARDPASDDRDRRLRELVDETVALSSATNAFAYFNHELIRRPASFQLALLALGLEEARARGARVPQPLLDTLLDRLQTARTPGGGFAYYAATPDEPGPAGTGSPQGTAGRNPACELALAQGGRGSDADVAKAVACQRQNLSRLERHSRRRDRERPTHDPADHQVAPYYYLFSLHWTARSLSRLPEADRRAAAEDLLASILAQEVRSEKGEPIGIWEDSEEFSGPNYGTGTVLDTLGVLRPYLTRR